MDQNTTGIESYYKHIRRDVIEAVPSSARNVLSIGCASGVTEAELIKKGIRVYGIEMNPKAADHARQNGLQVFEGDVACVDIESENTLFDCIIYADVLEHMPDPEKILKRHIKMLSPGGTVFISVPNFRSFKVFWALFVKGYVQYTDAGIFDQTHIRITTRKMVKNWLVREGLDPIDTKYIIYKRKNRLMSKCFFGGLKELFASQVAVIGIKPIG